MKFLKFLLVLMIATFTFTAHAQNLQLKATNGKLINYGQVDTLTTMDSTLTVMDTMAIVNNTAGIIEVTVVGQSTAGAGVTGKQIYRYKKASGTLTLSAATDISAIVTDAGLASTGTFTFTATSYHNVQLKVKGKLATTVKWRSLIEQFAP